jgi:ribonucleoside-diphosphate reductase alpha chain
MMAAVQPFLSGAISKTINMPEESTIEDIMQAYIESWKLGLKAVAIYRDNSKCSQPLSAAGPQKESSTAKTPAPSPVEAAKPADTTSPAAQQAELFLHAQRRKLPSERQSITHKFAVGGHEGYITVGMYADGQPGEIFIKMAKEGSTVPGLMDSFALAVSISLQHGVPLKLFCEKFAHTRFEPNGWSSNPDIGFAKSIMDYIFRWLQLRFMTGQQQFLFENLRPKPVQPSTEGTSSLDATSSPQVPESRDLRPGTIHAADALASMIDMGDAPSCHVCGSIMVRNGSCYKCMSCGSTSGCS